MNASTYTFTHHRNSSWSTCVLTWLTSLASNYADTKVRGVWVGELILCNKIMALRRACVRCSIHRFRLNHLWPLYRVARYQLSSQRTHFAIVVGVRTRAPRTFLCGYFLGICVALASHYVLDTPAHVSPRSQRVPTRARLCSRESFDARCSLIWMLESARARCGHVPHNEHLIACASVCCKCD